jgi:hypothetical protein
MTRGVVVELQHLRQPLDRVVLRRQELLGSFTELNPQRMVLIAQPDVEESCAEQVVQTEQQLERVEWLAEKVPGSAEQRAALGDRRVVAGEDEDREVFRREDVGWSCAITAKPS